MKFQFNVHINDQDYLDYNTFWMLRSPYGKKQMMTFRVTLSVLLSALAFVFLLSGGFTTESFLSVIPMLIVLLLVQLILAPCFAWTLKGQIKVLKKSGKMGYSPSSVMEFYDDVFIETTPENKTQHTYAAVERVSVVDNKNIYIHVNNVMAYIVPLSCFASKEQYEAFLQFINTKCANIDFY